MNFGEAVVSLKEGKKVSREGWNGKKMFIYLNKGSVDFGGIEGTPKPAKESVTSIEGIAIGLFESGDTGTVTRLPNINMKSALGSTVTGWLASQTDVLAEDWGIVE